MQVFGCRDDGEVAAKFMTGVLNLPEVQKLLSSEHFSMDGTLIEAWASMKSLVPKDDADPPRQQGGRNGERDFRGEKRSNATHASTTPRRGCSVKASFPCLARRVTRFPSEPPAIFRGFFIRQPRRLAASARFSTCPPALAARDP